MNFADLRVTVLENAGPRIKVGRPQFDRVINRAYENLVNVVEQTAKFYNIVDTPITVSVVPGTTEYQVADATTTKIRKIYHLERTDLETLNITGTIIPFRQKNLYQSAYSATGTLFSGQRPIVWFHRNSDGTWDMGFPSEPSTAMTLKIYYTTPITPLATPTDVPTQIPEEHHELISLRATMTILAQNGISAGPWKEEFDRLLQLMMVDLESWNRTGPFVRQFHVSSK